MQKADIQYSEESINDLTAIFEFIANDSEARALEYVNRLDEAIFALEKNPKLGMACKRKLVRHDCRVLIVDSYLAFYRYDESKNYILIIRVLRESQDYSKLLMQ